MITQKRLKKILDYDHDTGVFTWKVRASSNVQIGDVAGCTRPSGYVQISVDRKLYFAHRLAFIWMTGKCPKEVDHINGVRSDNRWENLRAATRSQNQMNVRSHKGSSSKYLGVCWHKKSGKWNAQIMVGGKKQYLGLFDVEIDAAKTYDAAAKKHFEEFANLNFGDSEGI